MTENIFAVDNTQEDPNLDYLKELVGEGKKFKTDQDLAKGKWQSDQYIKTLEMQKDELRKDYLKLREDYEARAKLEELIDQMQKHQQPANSDYTPPAKVDKPGIDPKDIESLVSNKILELETSKKNQENFNIVKKKAQERYGSNYQEVLKQHREHLGISEEFANNLALNNPNVFIKTFELDQRPPDNFQSPPRSNLRSDNFNQKGNQKRTWTYYQELKKKDPRGYLSQPTQVQMHKDYEELGSAFEDGDFHLSR